MSTIFMILVILGPVLLFAIVKTGVRLIYPFGLCVVMGMIGMTLFIGASASTVPVDPEVAIDPLPVAAALMVATAAFGVLLLGVVVIARWLSGDYKSVKEGHDT